MIEVGSIVKSVYAVGIVIQMREGAYEGQPLAQVFWLRRGETRWVEAIDMEVISDQSR